MARILSLRSNGTISTESDIDYAARIARMKERRRGPELSELDLEREHARLDADVNDIEQLQNIGSSLESLSETVVALAKNNQLEPEEIQRFEQLASTIASPAIGDPIKLVDVDGQVSVESLVNTIRDIYASITAGIKGVVNSTTAFISKLRPTTGNLRRQIANAKRGLQTYRSRIDIDIIPDDAMATLVNADGEYDSVIISQSMSQLLIDAGYAVNELGSDTSTQVKQYSDWLAKLDLSSDEAFETSFDAIKTVAMVSPPSGWKAVTGVGEKRNQVARVSPVAFTGHQYLTFEPKYKADTPSEWLSATVFDTAVNYGVLGKYSIVPSEDVFTVADVGTVIRLLDQSLSLLDLHDVFSRTSVVTNKYLLNTIQSVNDITTNRIQQASALSEPNQAKLALAIQSVNALMMRTQRPYSDVLYETIRVINGVVSLAAVVKTAVEKAE